MNRSDEARPGVDDTDGDDRYLVIRGRRWRRTDPALEADVVRALKSHLGRARSQVGRAGRDDDPASVRSARDRVQLAKEGLGERGPAWWERPEDERRRQAADRLARLERLDASAHDADTDDDGGEQSHHGERPEGVDEERPGE